MKMRFLDIMFAAAALLVSRTSFAAQPKAYPFKPGETIEFKLQFRAGAAVDLGTAKFTLGEEDDNFVLDAHFGTSGLARSLYYLEHDYNSVFSKKDLAPISFRRSVKEGSSYWARNEYAFTNNGRKIQAKVSKSSHPEATDTLLTSSTPVRDLLSIFYLIRTIDTDALAGKTSEHHKIALDTDLVDLKISVAGKEEKKIPGLGKFNTVKLRVELESGRNIYIWLRDDYTHALLMLTAHTAIGTLVGRCIDYSA